MKQGYEFILVVDGELNDKDSHDIFEKYVNLIRANEGEVNLAESWERKKLAYPIKKKLFGFYYVCYFQGTPKTLTELNRVIRFDEFVFRSIVLKVKNVEEEVSFFKTIKATPQVHADLYYDLQKGGN